ncbi:MAG: hypothetical protein ABEJ72_01260, partial [Candidatus Aenigmatarchaeota archaeon]
VSLIILIMSITISYITSSIVTPISTYSTSELRVRAENLNNVVFKTKGIPKNWHWLNRSVRPSLGMTLFRRKIHLDEYNNTNNTDKNVKVHLDLNDNAYRNSLIVYEGNRSLETNVKNVTDGDSDNFLEEADIIFKVNVSANSEKTVNLYYSRDNSTEHSYESLSAENTTLNKTVFSERKIDSISRQKLNSLRNMSYEEVRDGFAMERNFYLRVENETSKIWEFGRKKNQTDYVDLPEGEDVVLFTNNMMYQRRDGKIKSIKTTTAVW